MSIMNTGLQRPRRWVRRPAPERFDNDPTNVNVTADPTITLSLGAELIVGTRVDYVATVINLGPGLLVGGATVVADIPDGLTPVAGIGAGWSCTTQDRQISCATSSSAAAGASLPLLRLRVLVKSAAGDVTMRAVVSSAADSNLANNAAEVTATTNPIASLRIAKQADVRRVETGGQVGYQVDVTNTGNIRVTESVLRDLLPRGFTLVGSQQLRWAVRSTQTVTPELVDSVAVWPLGTLNPGESVSIAYRVVVDADARAGVQENRAFVTGRGLAAEVVQAGPASAIVEVGDGAFSMLQVLIGRIYEDVDGDGRFTGADRPIPNARVITSTGQASITDPDGQYNVPSLGAGSVAVSLDRDTVPAHLTTDDRQPGHRSWTRLLRTPIGGGALLTQDFALRPARDAAAPLPPAAPVSQTALLNAEPQPELNADGIPAGGLPPRRAYESRLGSSLLVALGEVSFGDAAPEFDIFRRDGDTWGYGSLFLQTGLFSPKNRLTVAFDSHRRLNGTSGRDRLFELDPVDRVYPVFGDTSRRQELATANAKVFARLERSASYVQYGDLIGDLPESERDGGRWSSYQRHLTGLEIHVDNARGTSATLRGAQPSTSYARDVSSGPTVGLVSLTNRNVLPGTETVAVEVRDRRLPERLISREILARGTDYDLEPATGTLFLRRQIGGLEAALNLVQVVTTYEYESAGLDNLVFSGRALATRGGFRAGGAFFTEEGTGAGRFSVAGLDLEQRLPRGGRLRVDVPYSRGTPEVGAAVDNVATGDGTRADGVAVQADVEQPFAFWRGRVSGSFLRADRDFRNPFTSTVTPGAQYGAASLELSPYASGKLKIGASDERYETTPVDTRRTTASASWSQTIARYVTLTGGYDERRLDNGLTVTDSGLATGQVGVKVGDRVDARVGREQNVKDDDDPTYPDQTTIGARVRVQEDTSIFYAQRISDDPIVPIGNFTGTGVASLPTKGEIAIGVESRVHEATRLTSRYQVEQGISGTDAFAVVGAMTQIDLGGGFRGSFGGERGQLVSGNGDDYTSGSVGLAWLGSNRVKASARYEGRDRNGYTGLVSAGAAARVAGGITALGQGQWLNSRETTRGHAVSVLAAFAIRPATNDRAGLLFSYQHADADGVLLTVGTASDVLGWRDRLSSDGYLRPFTRLELYGKAAWQRTASVDTTGVDTYLGQGRAQFTLFRFLDGAIEERYLRQPDTDSSRRSTAAEIGVWPLADFRVALGYHFQDTRDPYGRDREGRSKGVYVTLSTKLSRLFNLMGSQPPLVKHDSR
jgi:uncharacterized repeat protein (TIGR01451 family)